MKQELVQAVDKLSDALKSQSLPQRDNPTETSLVTRLSEQLFSPELRRMANVALLALGGIVGGSEVSIKGAFADTSDRWENVARESVDLIEHNHFYDEQGRLVFDQIIFYDWSPEDSRYMVRAWRLVKNPAQIPVRDWRSTDDYDYYALWQDGEVLRNVRAKEIRESWTQFDPELVEREYLPKERRKELRNLAAQKPATPPVQRVDTPSSGPTSGLQPVRVFVP